jgi:hypothetical protein
MMVYDVICYYIYIKHDIYYDSFGMYAFLSADITLLLGPTGCFIIHMYALMTHHLDLFSLLLFYATCIIDL